jgi:glycerate 2-kinase
VHSAREQLLAIYRDALAALAPANATRDAVRRWLETADRQRPIHLLAVGKAAESMSAGAHAACAQLSTRIAGGLCIAHHPITTPAPGVEALRGDHPLPDAASLMAATRLGEYVQTHIARDDHVLVLWSGGASALVGAAAAGVDEASYRAAVSALFGAGLDIGAMNMLRRRISRWGGGRLGEALRARGAQVTVLAISDVPGDDLASIGSGPCVAESATLADTLRTVDLARLSSPQHTRVRDALIAADAAHRDAPTPGDTPIPHVIVSSNAVMLQAVARRASDAGIGHTTITAEPLTGDAHRCGVAIAATALALRRRPDTALPHLVCWGGEPLVTLPAEPPTPPGGRMQALVLRAAQTLHDAGADAHGITLLAAGTDGRDGPTDAAGAIVDAHTWSAIHRSGRDAAADLAALRSYDALASVDALIPAFVSGTNVNDVVCALIRAH